MNDSPSEIENTDGDDAAIGIALRKSLSIFAVIGLVAGVGIVSMMFFQEADEEVVGPAVAPTVRDTTALEIPQLPMAEISKDAGIQFLHTNGSTGEKLLPETMGSGCAFIDFDNDNDQDLFLVNGHQWPWSDAGESAPSTCMLLANDGTGKFTDVTREAGCDISLYGMGVAVGDFDNDGWTDLFLTGVGTGSESDAGPHRLLKNSGGKFSDVSSDAGVEGAGNAWGTSCGFADYDNDGRLDLFVCHYVGWSRELDAEQGFKINGTNRAYGPPRFFSGSFPQLFHNEGDGTFKDVSAAAGIQVRNRDTGVPLAKAMGLAPVDINNDGWIDFIVANDTVRNLLFLNKQDGTFSEVGELYNIAYDKSGKARGAMGIDVTWFRNDGTIAVCIGNFANEPSALFMYRPRRNQFFDAAMVTGLGPPTRKGLTFGMLFCDLDLDGRSDVIGTNGHLEEDISKFFTSQTYEQPMQMFWNAGENSDSELVHVPAEKTGGEFRKPIVGRGTAMADIDGDGDTDLVVTTNGGGIRLFRNDQSSGNHWVRLALRGESCNKNAIGAKVSVHVGEAIFRAHVMPTRSYLSQSELPITIGIGDADSIDKVTVSWPGGTEQTFDQISIDCVNELSQQSDSITQ